MRAAVVLMAAVLSGCATAPGGERRETELSQLRRECRKQDGILFPIPGAASGQVRADWYCEMHGGASRPRD